MQKNIPFFLLLLFIAGCTSTENTTTVDPETQDSADIYYKQDYFRYHDYEYKDNIKTVSLHKAGFDLSMPIIKLGSDDKLLLSFDDLDADIKSYRYEIIHCNASWQPTDILKTKYTSGYEDGLIENHSFSYNTMEDFTHYTLKFPKKRDFMPTISGNYIISVYESGHKNKPVLTRRFMIYEPKVSIDARVQAAIPPDKRQTHQEVDFSIKTGDYYIANPSANLKIQILQNKRWDSQIKNIKPRSITNKQLDYNYEGKLIFSGLNEFRFFDTRSLKHQVPGIKELYYDSLGNHVRLKSDKPRPYGNYTTKDDINGNFYIISYDVNREKELEADYTWVHFFMPYPNPMTEGNIYVMGELSNWQFMDQAKMNYNYKSRGYETTMYLKQGYYNYHYVFLPNGEDTGDASIFEGQHYETENNYTIFVYHRPNGSDYDKLIAVEKINTSVEK